MNEDEKRTKIFDKFEMQKYLYYGIIGIVSFIACVFLPMVGSDVGLGWNIPNTTVGWIVWVATKIIIAVINVLLFHCFMEQAKVNIKDDPKFIKANEILGNIKNDPNRKPLSPSDWNKKQYGSKGVTIFITSILSSFALTQAILEFDYVSMLTYLFTIIMGIIFGILQMKSAECYWTNEYYNYALYMQEQENQKKEKKQCYKLETNNIGILKSKSRKIKKTSNTSLKKKECLTSSESQSLES